MESSIIFFFFLQKSVSRTTLLRTRISIIANNVRHLFLYSFAIHVSSLRKGLFTSGGHSLLRLFVSYYWLLRFMSSGSKAFIRYVVFKKFLPVERLLFLNSYQCVLKSQVFHFDKVQCISLLFQGSWFWSHVPCFSYVNFGKDGVRAFVCLGWCVRQWWWLNSSAPSLSHLKAFAAGRDLARSSEGTASC